ncbi:thioredoxin family protein [Sphingomonas sp. KRR8]|uniref:protein-disulfide reductase DsbD family protein n=1 Tax=Sphingomonas sp. KRR8 TaxID=2942996 RepID=UPI002021169B|nr:thioredoxin family protein [Sphingomonas sp. KRR8]URD61036.1 thioredoxin family protein [Sphingomonas sp. KRR8]
MARFFLLLLALLTSAPAMAQLGSARPHITAQLVVDGPVRPGQEADLAILMTPEPGWHGYWSNPGDAGQPMTLNWQLPKGASVGPLRYPVPKTLTIAGLMNYVFTGPYAILTRLKVPADVTGTLPIRAKAFWLACTDEICVPEQGELSLDVPIGGGADEQTRFDGWRRQLPRPLGSAAHFAANGTAVRLGIPFPAGVAVDHPHFFPADGVPLDHAAPQRFSRDGDLLIAELTFKRPPTLVDGVLGMGPSGGLAIGATPGTVPTGGTPIGEAASTGWSALGWALLGALAGGLLLNLMPCVFPILALKALALARAGGDERHARHDALAYTAGAIVGTGALGIALLLIRAGGTAAGWAFQLQDPRTILVLLLLGTAITLNLLGTFKLPVLGGEASPRGGFATGALAAFVATPCAGPFMGAALGAALLLPAAGAILVFAALGLGIALPFLLVAFIPTLRKRLPKPGAWMLRLQRILAIPMGLSTLAALWLLYRQGGTSGLLLGLLAAALLVTALVLAGRRQSRGLPALGRPVAIALALAIVPLLGIGRGEQAVVTKTANAEAWSEARVAAYRQQNRPVFVYFTADWCLTCKVNEANAIDRAPVQDAFKAAHVAVLAGDWTNGDPAITRFLESRARAGVPLYLWYAPGKEPEELPQILTPAMLTERAQGS